MGDWGEVRVVFVVGLDSLFGFDPRFQLDGGVPPGVDAALSLEAYTASLDGFLREALPGASIEVRAATSPGEETWFEVHGAGDRGVLALDRVSDCEAEAYLNGHWPVYLDGTVDVRERLWPGRLWEKDLTL